MNGFVRFVDVLGDDMSVVKAARVSYGNETKGEEADKKLINFLMKHNHGTPFEHVVFTFHVKCPIFIARQWFRHRIGSFNEISLRYTAYEDEFWFPDEWRTNNQDNKQSSGYGDYTDEDLDVLHRAYGDAIYQSVMTYNSLIDMGVSREQARAILPMATYTEFYWTVNARSLFNFITLRSAPNAQKEIRDYADEIKEMVRDIIPWTYEAYERCNE